MYIHLNVFESYISSNRDIFCFVSITFISGKLKIHFLDRCIIHTIIITLNLRRDKNTYNAVSSISNNGFTVWCAGFYDQAFWKFIFQLLKIFSMIHNVKSYMIMPTRSGADPNLVFQQTMKSHFEFYRELKGWM